MTKSGAYLTAVAVMLAAAYIYFFTDWFHTQTIQIIPVIRPDRPSRIPRSDETQVYPVAFKLDGNYRLTTVKVVTASELATNKYAVPLWHLISEKGSQPTDNIIYGGLIKGMKPKTPRAKPEPLEANIPYVLLVEAGSIKGQTNFYTREVVHPR
jgi:hypothetical protein